MIYLYPIICALLGILLLQAAPSAAQPTFTAVPNELGLPPFSLVWANEDYNNDGRADFLAMPFSGSTTFLFNNQGGSKYLDQTASLLPTIDQKTAKGHGALFGDYDNDGDLDLYLPLGAGIDYHQDAFLRNDDGAFHDITIEAGLGEILPSDNALWLDYDRDGWLDLYVGSWRWDNPNFSGLVVLTEDPPLRNRLYRNQGDGTFANVTAAAGLDLSLHPADSGTGGGMVSADFNDDGWPDLYLGVLKEPNQRWRG